MEYQEASALLDALEGKLDDTKMAFKRAIAESRVDADNLEAIVRQLEICELAIRNARLLF